MSCAPGSYAVPPQALLLLKAGHNKHSLVQRSYVEINLGFLPLHRPDCEECWETVCCQRIPYGSNLLFNFLKITLFTRTEYTGRRAAQLFTNLHSPGGFLYVPLQVPSKFRAPRSFAFSRVGTAVLPLPSEVFSQEVREV